GMPKDSDADRKARHDAMQAGLKQAVQGPLEGMRTADACWGAMGGMGREGNFASRSRPQGGARAAEARSWGASRNVAVNLPGIEDESFRNATSDEAERLASRAASMRETVLQTLAGRTD